MPSTATSTTTTSLGWRRSNEIPPYDASKSAEISTELSGPVDLGIEGNQVNGPDLPMFNFNCIAATTNNFSEENKLGQGGFGLVYKVFYMLSMFKKTFKHYKLKCSRKKNFTSFHYYQGTLPGGQEIAVKRLSRKSGQGLEEFKNEIILIAKLQHRNLVRLLGCCIQGEEKMLLYEYMPNKSLDSFIFGMLVFIKCGILMHNIPYLKLRFFLFLVRFFSSSVVFLCITYPI